MAKDFRGVEIGGGPAPTISRTVTAPKRQPTPDESAAAQAQANSDGTVAHWDSSSGSFSFRPMTSGEQIERNQQKDAHPDWFTPDGSTPAPANTAPVVNSDLVDQALNQFQTPVTNSALNAPPKRAAFDIPATPGAQFIRPSNTVQQKDFLPPGFSTMSIDPNQQAALEAMSGPPKQVGDEAPDLDRTKVDNILNGLSGYQNKIADLAEDNTGLSVAEAQLKKATDLANLQAGIDTEASQRAALGQARSARSRNDRGLLERQAVGEAAFVGQEAARTASLRQAEQEGNLAELRAQEADYDRRFRLEALGKAADLGLNRSALEVDISKTNLDSATNWINQQFGQLGIDKNINQEQAQSLLGYTRDMAAIQLQYDQLNSQEQQQADALLMQKYGIDQQTMVAMKEIKEKGKFHWDQVLAGVAGGVGTAATAGAAKALGIG